jgi:hypothetical protein
MICRVCRQQYQPQWRHDDAIDADVEQCPNCRTRNFRKELAAEPVKLLASAKLRGRRGGKRKPFVIVKIAQELWRDAKKLVQREYRIDHEAKRYTETVIDPDTGQIIHKCDALLDQHHRRCKKTE